MIHGLIFEICKRNSASFWRNLELMAVKTKQATLGNTIYLGHLV